MASGPLFEQLPLRQPQTEAELHEEFEHWQNAVWPFISPIIGSGIIESHERARAEAKRLDSKRPRAFGRVTRYGLELETGENNG